MHRALLVAILLAAPVQAWPMFQGDPLNTGAPDDLVPDAQVWWSWSTPEGQHVVAAPVADERAVIIADTSGTVTALDVHSGRPLWSHAMGKSIASTPAIALGWVYVADTSGKLTALDMRTGEPVAEATIGATRAPITIAEGKIFIGTESGEMIALTATTLDILWRFKVSDVKEESTFDNTTGITTCVGGAHPTRPVRTAAAVHLGVVVFGSMNHYVYAVDEQGNPDQTTDLQWRHRTSDIVLSSPVVDTVRGRVYVASYDETVRSLPITPQDAGTVPCIGAAPSSQWLFDVPGPIDASKVHSTPAFDGQRLYFGANNGNVYAISAASGARAWQNTTGGPVLSSPVVANGTVVVGSDDGILRWLRASDGGELARFKAEAPIKTGVAVLESTVIAVAEDGKVYRLGGELPARADLSLEKFEPQGKGISIVVRNMGKVGSEPTVLQVWLNGTLAQEFPVPALGPGAEVELYFLPLGVDPPYDLEAILDANETLLEAGRENNRLTQVVTPPTEEDTVAPTPTVSKGLLGLAWWIWITLASVVVVAGAGAGVWLWLRGRGEHPEWYIDGDYGDYDDLAEEEP